MSTGRLARRALLGLLLVAAMPVSIWAVTELRLSRVHSLPVNEPVEAGSLADLERGRRLVTGVGLCTFCHGHDLAGKVVVDDPWLGRLYAPNLTSGIGGAAALRSDDELARAIRWGVDTSGRSLLLMPSEHLLVMTPEDVAAVTLYLRSVPPVDTEVPDKEMGPLTRLALVLGLSPELFSAERSLAARDRVLTERSEGAYLASVGSCRVCHGDALRGGLHPLALPEEPEPPDISGHGPMANWSQEQFRLAMRSGLTPDGRNLDPRYMPWPQFAELRDDELGALFEYLSGTR
jgi:mono/diheme cytochrome c family protein